ncbi:hypothetical protein [Microtetraspora malaysiensis]|uniref:hypothetical protein n=1 Tax=Microtetraspora malaysiensis TaxID=161358 RepID=UPI003D8BC750
MEFWEYDGDHYCLLSTYVKSDEAWYFELSEARPAPTAWRNVSQCGDVLPGITTVTVVAHDPDVEKPPYVFFGGDQEFPFEVLSHFLTRVAKLLKDGTQPSDPG